MKHIHTFFSLSLLLVFVCCSFLLIMMQMKGYTSIQKENAQMHQSHTPIAYLSNKVKFYDSFSIQEMDGIQVLVLNNEVNHTLLYQYKNSLYEYDLQDISLFQASMGNALFTCKHLAFHVEGSTLEIQWNDKAMTFQFREKVDS